MQNFNNICALTRCQLCARSRTLHLIATYTLNRGAHRTTQHTKCDRTHIAVWPRIEFGIDDRSKATTAKHCCWRRWRRSLCIGSILGHKTLLSRPQTCVLGRQYVLYLCRYVRSTMSTTTTTATTARHRLLLPQLMLLLCATTVRSCIEHLYGV